MQVTYSLKPSFLLPAESRCWENDNSLWRDIIIQLDVYTDIHTHVLISKDAKQHISTRFWISKTWKLSFFHPPHEVTLSLLVHNRDESCFHLSLAPFQPPTVFGITLNACRIQKSPGHTRTRWKWMWHFTLTYPLLHLLQDNVCRWGRGECWVKEQHDMISVPL